MIKPDTQWERTIQSYAVRVRLDFFLLNEGQQKKLWRIFAQLMSLKLKGGSF